jgi:acetate kinase
MRLLLTINAGSSSVKLAIHRLDGAADAAPIRRSSLRHGPGASHADVALATRSEADALLASMAAPRWTAVVHRIVHGGTIVSPSRIDAEVLEAVGDAIDHAPLHNPLALALIDAFERADATQAQYAVFDTGFFASLPEVASRYALPDQSGSQTRRRGFHGLAHASLWREAAAWFRDRSPLRVITVHLGAGASIAAIRDGQPIEISMGYSTLEGLVMATRCGDIDPGLLLDMLAAPGADLRGIRRTLFHGSGLLGLSGRSSQLSDLLDQSQDERCRLAVDVYVHRIRHYLGAYLAALGGADSIVFGGGIGENEPRIRSRVLESFDWAGFAVSASANERLLGAGAIGAGDPGDARRVLVGVVDESMEMVRMVRPLVNEEC